MRVGLLGEYGGLTCLTEVAERRCRMGVSEPGRGAVQPDSRLQGLPEGGPRAAGLKDFHFHDLRHHGATMAVNAGFNGTDRDAARRVTDVTLRAAAEAVAGAGSIAVGRQVTALPQSRIRHLPCSRWSGNVSPLLLPFL